MNDIDIAPTIHAMTIDVEDYFHVAALSNVISQIDWELQPSRVVNNTKRLLDIFDVNNIKATFFILGWVAEHEPDLVKSIYRAGHEIASHGYSHQLIYNQSPSVFRSETRKAKNIIEDIIGNPIHGYRAASYSITKHSLWALDILVEEGFIWDSSIFPVYHDNYGIPETPTEPYCIQTQNGGTITEFPITTAHLLGMAIPAAGGGYFRQFPYSVFKFLFDQASRGKPNVFYIHPWELDPNQPRFNNASWFSKFRHYTNLHKSESRLQQLLTDFNFSTIAESLSKFKKEAIYINTGQNLIKLS